MYWFGQCIIFYKIFKKVPSTELSNVQPVACGLCKLSCFYHDVCGDLDHLASYRTSQYCVDDITVT